MKSAEFIHSQSPLSFAVLFELPFYTFTSTWSGETPQRHAKLFLAADRSQLFYGAEVSGYPTELRRARTKGEYVEGLWSADVIELFIFRDQDERYLELNLSPSGAWWAMGFREYRVRDEAFSPPSGTAQFFSRTNEHWRAALSIPIREIPNLSASPRFSGNICAVLKGEFFSLAEHASGPPDFHKPRLTFEPTRSQQLE